MGSKIPKKFSKIKKSFIDRIEGDINSNSLSSFCAFPPGVSFNGQDEKEHIVLMVRKHPAVFIPQMILTVVLLFTPTIISSVLNEVVGKGHPILMLGISLFCLILAITVAVDTYFKWFYTVNIITEQRIVDVDFINILYHKYSEAQLERIEDVTHQPVGLLSTIFDFGSVFIQTAGAKPEFVFDSVPRARDVQDTLLDLLELKQEGTL